MGTRERTKQFPKRRRRFKKHTLEIIIEFVILVLLIPTFFSLSLLVGSGYLFAFAVSVYRGTIFRRKHVARFIVIGSIFTYIAGLIISYSLNQKDWITFLMIVSLGIAVWFQGVHFKHRVVGR